MAPTKQSQPLWPRALRTGSQPQSPVSSHPPTPTASRLHTPISSTTQDPAALDYIYAARNHNIAQEVLPATRSRTRNVQGMDMGRSLSTSNTDRLNRISSLAAQRSASLPTVSPVTSLYDPQAEIAEDTPPCPPSPPHPPPIGPNRTDASVCSLPGTCMQLLI
jgi:hypothetical protein